MFIEFSFQVKMLVSRTAHNEKVQYHRLTDKALPVNETNATQIEINETDIDPSAPKGMQFFSMITLLVFFFFFFFKGNLLFLPSHVSIFTSRSTTNDGNTSLTSVDNQRAMKQLEMSNKIQTGLELKIDTLKKEIRTFEIFFTYLSINFAFCLSRKINR